MDANASKYAVPTWGGSQTDEVVLPSGHKCLCRRLSIPMLVKTNMLDKMDQIAPEVEENITGPANGRKKPQDRPAKKLTKAEQKAADEKAAKERLSSGQLGVMFEMMSVLIPEIVVEPQVLSGVYTDSEGKIQEVEMVDRLDGEIYGDTIPIPDQIAIFEWAMEGMDMEEVSTFREKQSEGVEPLADDASVSPDSE